MNHPMTHPGAHRRHRTRADCQGACPPGGDAVVLATTILEHGRPYVLRSGDVGCRWGQLHLCLTRLGHLYVLTPAGITTVWDSRPGLPPVIRGLALDLVALGWT